MKPKRGAGLFARTPKGDPVYFSMICSASSSRRLICHVLSERLPARGAAQERHHKPNTLLPSAFGFAAASGCSGASDAGSLALHQLLLLKEAVEHRGDLRAGRRALRVKHPVGLPLDQTAADRPLHRCPCII